MALQSARFPEIGLCTKYLLLIYYFPLVTNYHHNRVDVPCISPCTLSSCFERILLSKEISQTRSNSLDH